MGTYVFYQLRAMVHQPNVLSPTVTTRLSCGFVFKGIMWIWPVFAIHSLHTAKPPLTCPETVVADMRMYFFLGASASIYRPAVHNWFNFFIYCLPLQLPVTVSSRNSFIGFKLISLFQELPPNFSSAGTSVEMQFCSHDSLTYVIMPPSACSLKQSPKPIYFHEHAVLKVTDHFSCPLTSLHTFFTLSTSKVL